MSINIRKDLGEYEPPSRPMEHGKCKMISLHWGSPHRAIPISQVREVSGDWFTMEQGLRGTVD